MPVSGLSFGHRWTHMSKKLHYLLINLKCAWNLFLTAILGLKFFWGEGSQIGGCTKVVVCKWSAPYENAPYLRNPPLRRDSRPDTPFRNLNEPIQFGACRLRYAQISRKFSHPIPGEWPCSINRTRFRPSSLVPVDTDREVWRREPFSSLLMCAFAIKIASSPPFAPSHDYPTWRDKAIQGGTGPGAIIPKSNQLLSPQVIR